MKNSVIKFASLSSLMVLLFGLNACGETLSKLSDAGTDTAQDSAIVDVLNDDAGESFDASSQQDIENCGNDLVYLREEEKLARDTYQTLAEQWTVQVFTNIARSEQMHMDEVLLRLNELGLEDPIVDDSTGAFVNPTLGNLYNELVALGSNSELDALLVGTTIEDLDIADIEEMIEHCSNSTVLESYENLACGSRNHMRAFYRQVVAQGGSYQAQYISQTKLDEILASPSEVCN